MLIARLRFSMRRVSSAARLAAALVLAAGVAMSGGCSTESDGGDVDPASLGFQQYFMCSNDADLILIGKRDTADLCLAACQTVSKTMLNDTAKACWWQDGRAGRPRDCRVCKTTAPEKDAYLNNWAMTLPAAP